MPQNPGLSIFLFAMANLCANQRNTCEQRRGHIPAHLLRLKKAAGEGLGDFGPASE
jgi:hypothetical protein